MAITGIGLVTPIGHDTSSTWDALLAGKSGIATIESFDASTFPTKIAAEVKGFDPEKVALDKNELEQTVRFTAFALAAAEEALNDAGIRPDDSTAERWGLIAGSGMMTSTFESLRDFQRDYAPGGKINYRKMHADDHHWRSPLDFARKQPNSGLGLLAQRHNIRGYATSMHTACTSGGQALGLALQVIRNGDADAVLAGGYDSMIDPIGVGSFCLLGALSTENDDPPRASRPFDLTRSGFVLGEGAAFLILEEWQAARTRGTKIYAELAGEGNSLSCYRVTDSHPSGDGPIQAIRSALHDAGASGDTVDYINAHGTSTQMNDLCETNAIKAVFGVSLAKAIPISSTKSQMGHLVAAAGAVEGALCALAIHASKIPMTMNLTRPDPRCDLDYVHEGVRERKIRIAASNSFGFGGSNSCIVFRNPSEVETGG